MSFEYKVTGKAFDWKVLRRVLGLVRGQKPLFILAVLLTVAGAVLGPTVPFLIQRTIDTYIAAKDADGLLRLSMLTLAVMMTQTIVTYRQTYLTAWLGQMAVSELRKRIFRHILHFRLRVYDRTAVGTMMTRVISDVESVAEIFSQGVISIIGDILLMLAIITYMFSQDWMMSLVSLSVLPFLLLSSYYFKESVKSAFQEVRTQVGRMNAFLQEHIVGMFIVQVFNREQEESHRFDDINRLHRDANIRSVFAYSVFFPVVEVLSAISIALIVWHGAARVLSDDMTFGKIVAFTLYINLLFRPIRQIADKFNTLQMGIVSSDRIFQVLDYEDTIKDSGTEAPELKGSVEFQKVWFAYNDEDWVLRDLDFKLQAGKTLAIVGHTGSGKSSIINLISRLYTHQQGEILVDGMPVEDIRLEWLRRNISVVLQDVFLFSDTIYNNICLYNDGISKNEVIRAAQLVGAHEFIERLPGGYDFVVQERGATLSTGQRQLISFIRAIIQNPRILILDEATSSIDQETEELLQNATDVLLKGRTSIVIAHRLSTIVHADEIIVLEKGQIVERGTHRELLQRGGLYRKLYELQFAEMV